LVRLGQRSAAEQRQGDDRAEGEDGGAHQYEEYVDPGYFPGMVNGL
jgi:hypothetical protein